MFLQPVLVGMSNISKQGGALCPSLGCACLRNDVIGISAHHFSCGRPMPSDTTSSSRILLPFHHLSAQARSSWPSAASPSSPMLHPQHPKFLMAG